MYASVRTYPGSSDLADALVEHEDAVRNLIGGIGGFKAYYVVRGADGTATVSVFDDEAGANESTRVAAGWMRENLPDFAGSPPQVFAGEVVISA